MINKMEFLSNKSYSMPFTIMLDLDGVMSNWFEPTSKVCNLDLKDPEIRKVFSKTDARVENIYPQFQTNVEAAGYDFWYNMPLMPWAKSLYNTLIQYANVTFLTSPSSFSACYHAKRLWVKKHFDSDSIIITTEKYHCAAPWRYLIDDSFMNVKLFRKNGGNGYCWPNYLEIIDKHYNVNSITEEILTDIRHVKYILGK